MLLAIIKKGLANMKAGLNKTRVIEMAANIADERGIAHVTLKVLAAELGVKPPSLYKHYNGGIDELNKELMLYGWHSLENKITKAAIGRAKDDAIMANAMLIIILLLSIRDCLKLCNGTICISQRNICKPHKAW